METRSAIVKFLPKRRGMKVKNPFVIVLVAVVVIIIYYSVQVSRSSGDYVINLINERKAKNEFMRSADDSPFGAAKKEFKGLNYFEPDLHYRISATLHPIQEKKIVTLPASDGSEMEYLEYGHAEFKMSGEVCKLLILELLDDAHRGTLFLAFADATSALETYGAGRYLDLKKTPGATSILLDFNEAYNPYCAYSENYACPLPPRENILKIAIRAGEKKYHD